jgi:hypothetical protein
MENRNFDLAKSRALAKPKYRFLRQLGYIRDHFRTILQITSVFFMILTGIIYADGGLPNPSIRPEAQNKNLEVFADLLCWYASETVDWAFTLDHNQNSIKTDFKTFGFDWAPGFRVGLGYNLENDQWDTRASYTWFQSIAKGHAQGSVTPSFFAARLSLLEPFSQGKASLHLHYNMFDWDLGRGFLVSKCLFLQPSIGLKGGWITQTIHSSWTIPVLNLFLLSSSENVKQTFNAGGPKGAVTAKWCFENIQKHSFSLIGQFEAGYLWGHWSIRDKFVDELGTIIHVNTTNRNFGSFMLHSFLGLGWDCNFNRKQMHFSSKLGYEIEDWFNQYQLFTDDSGSQNNDLILQGVNFSLSLSF